MRELTCVEIGEQDLPAHYVAGRLSDDVAEALESHYLTCRRCYNELRFTVALRELIPDVLAIEGERPQAVEVGTGENREIAWAAPALPATRKRVRRRVGIGAAVTLAAAAALTVMVVRPARMTQTPAPVHRDEMPAATTLPVPQAPAGEVAAAREFRWLPVTGADRYQITLYDAEGAVIWEGQTSGTSVALPAGSPLEPGRTYLWEVAARVDWNRWVRSPLTRFQVRGRQ